MSIVRALLFLALLSCAALTVAAHHPGAMFDDKKSLTLSGTVKEFQWTHPHCCSENDRNPVVNGKLTVAPPSH